MDTSHDLKWLEIGIVSIYTLSRPVPAQLTRSSTNLSVRPLIKIRTSS